jgi:hypothetical protein
VIKAFFDESYNPNNLRMFAVACILAHADEWEQIEIGWKAALAEKNAELAGRGKKRFSRYHAAEMNAHDGEFSEWDGPEIRAFTEKLLDVIRGKRIFILSFAMILDDMVKVFPEWADDPKAYAYGFAFMGCLPLCGRLAAMPEYFDPQQLIRVWHDQGEWNHVALDAWERTKKDRNYSESWRFDECTRASAVTNVCLQPADMMAYECWRESERLVYESKERDMRPFFSHLVNIEHHRVYAAYADERYFHEHREILEKSNKK